MQLMFVYYVLGGFGEGFELGEPYAFPWTKLHIYEQPRVGAPANPNTSIVHLGTAQGNEPTANEPADKINPYSGMWFTNYGQASGTTHVPKPSKVYAMQAEAQSPVRLPIQYVAESYLAGGEPGAVYSNGYILERRLVNNVRMHSSTNTMDIEWHKGSLRFSAVKIDPSSGAFIGLHDPGLQSIHANRTALYLRHVAVGQAHEKLNPAPNPKPILDYPLYDQDGQIITNASSKYHIPEGDELWDVMGTRVNWRYEATSATYWLGFNGNIPPGGIVANNDRFRIGGTPTRFVCYTTQVRGFGTERASDGVGYVAYYDSFPQTRCKCRNF